MTTCAEIKCNIQHCSHAVVLGSRLCAFAPSPAIFAGVSPPAGLAFVYQAGMVNLDLLEAKTVGVRDICCVDYCDSHVRVHLTSILLVADLLTQRQARKAW